jgi:Protein of unknown function (DUF2585)
MNEEKLSFDLKKSCTWIAMFAILAVTPLVLRWEGRAWWCSCGNFNIWAGDIWSQHNSQHLTDPYSFTHILHGVLFCGILALVMPKISWKWRLCFTILLESGWEILENSQFIINRYRESTMALGYNGDSILNSVGDILCCTAGFLIARKIGLKYSIMLFIAFELLLLIWIRDNLTLNIIMLIYPVKAIKDWQVIGI